MSFLETRKIEPQSGTTVTLGAGGDTVLVSADQLKTNTVKDAGGNTIFTSNGAGTLSSVNSGLNGGMTLVSTQTAPAGTSSIAFTSGLGDYDEIVFYFTNIQHSNDDRILSFQVSTDGGSTYGVAMSSTNFYASHAWSWSNTAQVSYDASRDLANSTSYQLLTQSSDNGGTITGSNASGELHMFGCASTTYAKQWYARVGNIFYIESVIDNFTGGFVNSASAINAINFKPDSNTFKGTIAMYGIS